MDQKNLRFGSVAFVGAILLLGLASAPVIGQLVSRPKSGSPLLTRPTEGTKDPTVVLSGAAYPKKPTPSTIVTIAPGYGPKEEVVVAPILELMPKPGTSFDFDARIVAVGGSEYPKHPKKPNAWTIGGSTVYINWDAFLQAFRIRMTQSRMDYGNGTTSANMGPAQATFVFDLSLYDHASRTNYFTRTAVQMRASEIETYPASGG